MSKQFPSLWSSYSGRSGLTSQYPTPPNGKAQNGSLGVAGYVSQDYGEGAITYVEYSYAVKSGFPVAKVLNSAGYYVEPTASSVAVALLQAQINTNASSVDYLTQILDGVYNAADPRTYPLSSYSYMIVPTQVAGIFTEDKGKTLAAFARYMVCEGQQQATALGYSPLPLNLVTAASDQIKRIPGSANTGVDPASCNNPTFKAGGFPGQQPPRADGPSARGLRQEGSEPVHDRHRRCDCGDACHRVGLGWQRRGSVEQRVCGVGDLRWRGGLRREWRADQRWALGSGRRIEPLHAQGSGVRSAAVGDARRPAPAGRRNRAAPVPVKASQGHEQQATPVVSSLASIRFR